MTTKISRVVFGTSIIWLGATAANCSSQAEDGAGTANTVGGSITIASSRAAVGSTPSSNSALSSSITTVAGGPSTNGQGSLCSATGQPCALGNECCTGRCDFGLCLGATGLCSADGTQCSASAECCSGRCESNDGTSKICVPSTGACQPGGQACKANGDCCSGVCGADGLCPVFARCQTAGEPCTGHHECCTGVCADPGTGTPVCQYVGGCRPIGEVCDSEEDCCSLLCQAESSSGIKRCTKPAGCMWPGEVCWTGQAANCCPQGRNGGNSLCQPSIMGVRRCFTSGTTEACLPDGSSCAFGDECCGARCVPDANGALKCSAKCIPIGASLCTSNADCCEGICNHGSCSTTLDSCIAFGQSCTADADCCTGLCSDGTCTAHLLFI